MKYDFSKYIQYVRRALTTIYYPAKHSMGLWYAIVDSGIFRGYYEGDLRIILLNTNAIIDLLLKNVRQDDTDFGYGFSEVIGTTAGIYLTWILEYNKTYEDISSKIALKDLSIVASQRRGMNFNYCLEKANEQFKDVLESL